MNEERKHKILRGDWIIREPADPPACHSTEQILVRHLGLDPTDYESFSDHAIFVMNASQAHITAFDPILGRPIILPFDRYPGQWRYAQKEAVEATWILAKHARRDHAMQIELEMKNFPYRHMEAR